MRMRKGRIINVSLIIYLNSHRVPLGPFCSMTNLFGLLVAAPADMDFGDLDFSVSANVTS